MYKVYLTKFLISEKVASLIGCSISTSLPNPQKHHYYDSNPILRCLVDQCLEDPEWNGKFRTENDLGNEVIKALEERRIQWPGSELIQEKEWIQKMKTDIAFYRNYSGTAKQMEDFEYLLFELAANLLKRKIKLYSFNAEHPEVPKIFNSKGSSEFSLLGCTSIKGQNFFISLQRQPSKEDQSQSKQRRRKRDKCKVS